MLLAAGALLAGCGAPATSAHGRTTSGVPTIGSDRGSTATGTSGPLRLPRVTAWHPNRGDVDPLVKLVAVRDVEQRGNTARAALQVVDAQYGGLSTDAASVLVVCQRWTRRPDGSVRSGGSTFDVRVGRVGRRWHVTAIHPSHPGPAAVRVSPTAHDVLGSSRITLPPASIADVRSGRVHDSVLSAMLLLSRSYRLGVSVVRSGHPRYVFGTDRLSDHPQGRAFDTWQIDGRLVVDPGTPRGLVAGYMAAAAAAGSYNVGGPYLLGSAPQFFSDATHHDHVHAGFAS